MAIDFPSTPSNGQTYSYAGISYQYNTSIGAWTIIPSDVPPIFPVANAAYNTANAAFSNANSTHTFAVSAFNSANTKLANGSMFINGTVRPLALNETQIAPTISAGTLTLDCAAGNIFKVNLNSNITTLTFSNVPAPNSAYGLILSLTADGTARTVAWGTSVKWPSNTAPTLTSTNAKVDTFVLLTWDAGTTWYGFTGGQNA